MGQAITVTMRKGASDDVRIFDLDRSLTGMAIERYECDRPVPGSRPPDVLAARLFGLGARSITVYSSAIAVTAPASDWERIGGRATALIEHLFEYYGDDAGWSPEALSTEGGAETPAEAV